MIPISIEITGFGPFIEPTRLDFAALNSPVAVTAPFGTGKTFLIEAIPACLYGEMGWYKGSIYEALTQGGDGKAQIELVFEHGGQRYRAIREIRDTGKTRTQKAWLYPAEETRAAESLGEAFAETGVFGALAGPKVSDFEDKVRALMGDVDTFFATVFMSQAKTGDLCGQPGESDLVARRRAVFNDLIGAAHLDAQAEKCATEQRRETAVAEELEAQIAGETAIEAELHQALKAVPDAESESTRAEITLGAADGMLETLRARLRDSEGGDEQLKAQIAQHDAALRSVVSAQAALEKARANVKALETKAAGKAKAQADLADLARLALERKALNGQQNLFETFRQWRHDLANLEQVEMYEAKRVQDLMAMPGASDEERALAERLGELRDQYRKTDEENAAANGRNVQRRSIRQRLERDLHATAQQIERLTARLDKRPETPFGEKCEPCPFLAEYRDIPDEIERQVKAAAAMNLELDAVPPDEPIIDLSDLITQGERAAAADKAVKAAAETMQKLADANRKHQDAAAAVTVHKGKRPCETEPNDPREQIETVNKAIDALNGAQQRLEYALDAETALTGAQAEDEAQSGVVRSCQEEVELLAPAAASARAALADRESARMKVRSEVQAAETARNEAQAALKEATQELANVRARIVALEERLKATAEKRERAAGLRADIAALADLRACFGPKGVRQILIDAAAPELEAIADDLFERATGGRMRLRIATQRANQDGSTAEDFAILVRDERGEREALRYSGGQLQLIQILFRIAVAIWVGKIRGHKPDCLFLDEAFDRLGAEGAESLIEVLDYLRERFGLIVVVTHDRLLADRMAAQVRLERRFGAVVIECSAAMMVA